VRRQRARRAPASSSAAALAAAAYRGSREKNARRDVGPWGHVRISRGDVWQGWWWGEWRVGTR
jgi:hypothetical protein